jgi:hypothetical protein
MIIPLYSIKLSDMDSIVSQSISSIDQILAMYVNFISIAQPINNLLSLPTRPYSNSMIKPTLIYLREKFLNIPMIVHEGDILDLAAVL